MTWVSFAISPTCAAAASLISSSAAAAGAVSAPSAMREAIPIVPAFIESSESRGGILRHFSLGEVEQALEEHRMTREGGDDAPAKAGMSGEGEEQLGHSA